MRPFAKAALLTHEPPAAELVGSSRSASARGPTRCCSGASGTRRSRVRSRPRRSPHGPGPTPRRSAVAAHSSTGISANASVGCSPAPAESTDGRRAYGRDGTDTNDEGAKQMRDLRVIELAGSVAGAYCGRLFTVMGADVVLVEPADGAPLRRRGPLFTAADGSTRSALHEHLDAGKRSVTVDLDGPDGDAALAWADVVIVTVDGDPADATDLRERLRTLNPRASLVAISGFGLTGPYAGWRTSDLVDWASGGYLFLNGEPGRAPLQGGGPWASIVIGATAARRRCRRRARRHAHGRGPARRRRRDGGHRRRAPVGADAVHPHRRAQATRRPRLRALPPARPAPLQRRLDRHRRAERGAVRPDVHHVRGVGADGRRHAARPGARVPTVPRRSTRRSTRGCRRTRARRPSPRCRRTGCRPAG